jgi:transcriptional regulator with XRE-family HTH domain
LTALIGSLLREYRRARGLTQDQLAARSGISAAAIRDLEQGRTRHPNGVTLTALITALGLGITQADELERAAASPGLWLEVLGPLTIRRNGMRTPAGGPAQRALLGLLALTPGKLVYRSAIIDTLWPDNL